MLLNWTKLAFIFTLSIFFASCYCTAQSDQEHVRVALRMVGHQVLLNSGDSTSLVRPIEASDQTYSITFESEFDFYPNQLMRTIDSIVAKAKIANKYRVEVFSVDSNQVVYSSEISVDASSLSPCEARYYGTSAYRIEFTIVEPFSVAEVGFNDKGSRLTQESNLSYPFLWGFLGLMLLAVIYFWRKKRSVEPILPSNDTVQIGQYRFDERNMKLFFKNNHVDLTSKETDLLKLLYSSVNNTLERDEILKVVWGDEGDYVGRTLDVFISKLRKKISEDENVRIVNVRGVGYKLILNE